MTWEEFLKQIAKYKDGATVAGEMQMPGLSVADVKVDDIPLSPSVNYKALTDGDEKPHEVVVAMPSGKSKRGWNYTPEAVQSIVKQVNASTTAGFKGHQKAENVSTEFLDPATHWIGAKYDEDSKTAYFRGYIDPKEKDLRRWVKSGRIKETSIFGQMHLKKVAGETNVVDCELMSIDWTPLGRPGMQTKVVDMKIAGEMAEGGSESMNKEELLKAISEFMTANKISTRELAGEMDAQFIQQVEAVEGQLPALRTALGLAEDATFETVTASIKELQTAKEKADKADKQALVDAELGKIENEDVREFAGEMINFDNLSTDKEIAGEIATFLSKPSTKKIIDKMYTDNVTSSKRQKTSGNTNSGLRTRRTQL